MPKTWPNVRQAQDEDEEEEEDDEESTQGSTSYRRRDSTFLKHGSQAWMEPMGGKKKDHVIRIRSGDISTFSHQTKKTKDNEARQNKEELKEKKRI